MTLDELEGLKKAAAIRETYLGHIEAIRKNRFDQGVHHHPFVDPGDKMIAFGHRLDPRLTEAARGGIIAELQRWVADIEDTLRAGGVVFPEPAPTLRPPTSWDAEAGEFTFTVSSTGPERSERALGYSGYILVDQVIVPRGQVQSRHPAKIVTRGRTGESTIGKVVRVWEEDGQILGRARLLPEASAARAAVASGAVTNVAHLLNIREERVTQREGLRPLVTVEAWDIEGVCLFSDDPSLGTLDPLPVKDEPTYEVEFKVGGREAVKAQMKKTKVDLRP